MMSIAYSSPQSQLARRRGRPLSPTDGGTGVVGVHERLEHNRAIKLSISSTVSPGNRELYDDDDVIAIMSLLGQPVVQERAHNDCSTRTCNRQVAFFVRYLENNLQCDFCLGLILEASNSSRTFAIKDSFGQQLQLNGLLHVA
uniref:Uncharacterized protein n=1 Tax=Angiostrongylus cantonensis TaxID=6313 RepID=A0A0K0DFY8_ANGCA